MKISYNNNATVGASILLFITPSIGTSIPSQNYSPAQARSDALVLHHNGPVIDLPRRRSMTEALQDLAVKLNEQTLDIDKEIADAIEEDFWKMYEPL